MKKIYVDKYTEVPNNQNVLAFFNDGVVCGVRNGKSFKVNNGFTLDSKSITGYITFVDIYNSMDK